MIEAIKRGLSPFSAIPAPATRSDGDAAASAESKPRSLIARPGKPLDIKSLIAAQQEKAQEKEKTDAQGLTEEERAEVEKLKKRDQEVRRHEQAHAAAGGPYAGQPVYRYEQGPDGKRYAVSGHVSIDTSAIAGNPKATIRKMEVVKRAALAPAEPSSADRAVAAEAEKKKREAQAELREQKAEEQRERTTKEVSEPARPPGLARAADILSLRQAAKAYERPEKPGLNEASSPDRPHGVYGRRPAALDLVA